jgi:hypothetical protein
MTTPYTQSEIDSIVESAFIAGMTAIINMYGLSDHPQSLLQDVDSIKTALFEEQDKNV